MNPNDLHPPSAGCANVPKMTRDPEQIRTFTRRIVKRHYRGVLTPEDAEDLAQDAVERVCVVGKYERMTPWQAAARVVQGEYLAMSADAARLKRFSESRVDLDNFAMLRDADDLNSIYRADSLAHAYAIALLSGYGKDEILRALPTAKDEAKAFFGSSVPKTLILQFLHWRLILALSTLDSTLGRMCKARVEQVRGMAEV